MRERAGMVLAGIVLHLLLYGAAVPYAFSWDDRAVILGGPAVRGEEPLVAAAVRPWVSEEGSRGIAYRPVTLLSLGLDVRLFGLRPAPLRAVNLLLAGAGAGLLGLLVGSLGAGPWAAWGALILLACHPVRTEPVLSLAGRGELLSFLFIAAALVARRRPLLSGLWLLLALLSKESAFVAPALLALVALVERGTGREGEPGGAEPGRGYGRLAVAWGGAFVAAFAARVAILGGLVTGSAARISPGDNLLAGVAAGERFAGALSLLPLAFGRLVWPQVLSPDYSRTTFLLADLLAPAAVARGLAALLAAAVAAALLLGVPALRRRAPLVGFGVAWALVAYLPFANLLFPTGIAFTERLLFLPAAGVVAAIVGAGEALAGREGANSSRRLVVLLAALLLALLGSARIVRALPDWRDDRALMEAIERDLPANSKAPWNLALLSLGEGKTDEAAGHLARALALDPNYRVQARELVAHAEKIGRPDVAAALAAAIRSADRASPARSQGVIPSGAER